MPKLMQDNTQEIKIAGPGNFTFSAIRIEDLGATEYTLVTIICDVTGSVSKFADELLEMVKTVIGACKKNARSENLLIRYVLFNTDVMEVHGFLPLSSINENDYEPLRPYGTTALYDASFSGIGATLKMAESLSNQDFDVNGCVYVITDGDDNASKIVPSMIKDQNDKAIVGEEIESLNTIVIGITDENAPDKKHFDDRLTLFCTEAGITQFISAGDATAAKLAKLANFISESISSTSQALGSGQASQPLVF